MATKKPVTKEIKERGETVKAKLTPPQKLSKDVNSIQKIVTRICKLKLSNEAKEAAKTFLINDVCRITDTEKTFSYEEEI